MEFAASGLGAEFPNESESHFVAGVLAKVRGWHGEAEESFEKGLALAPQRYDLVVELASLYARSLRHCEAYALLSSVASKLAASPFYCDLAGSVFVQLGMPERALPLLQRAHQLQPEVDIFAANWRTAWVLLESTSNLQRFTRRYCVKVRIIDAIIMR